MNDSIVQKFAFYERPAYIQIFGSALFFNKAGGSGNPAKLPAYFVTPLLTRVQYVAECNGRLSANEISDGGKGRLVKQKIRFL